MTSMIASSSKNQQIPAMPPNMRMHPTGFASLRSARLRVMRIPLCRPFYESKREMDTKTAFNLLQKSLKDLCDAFNQAEFFPLLEADVAAYLYHRLLENGCPLSEVYNETRLCGLPRGKRKFNLAIGTVDTVRGCVQPALITQIKAFQRWGFSHQQHRRRFEGIISEDIESLKQASSIL